jgi:hypothetical protein
LRATPTKLSQTPSFLPPPIPLSRPALLASPLLLTSLLPLPPAPPFSLPLPSLTSLRAVVSFSLVVSSCVSHGFPTLPPAGLLSLAPLRVRALRWARWGGRGLLRCAQLRPEKGGIISYQVNALRLRCFFLVRLCDLVGAPRGRTGLFFRLTGRGGHLGGPATKWGGRGTSQARGSRRGGAPGGAALTFAPGWAAYEQVRCLAQGRCRQRRACSKRDHYQPGAN